MRIVMIAAVAKNGVIGVDGGLPWHLPDDLRRFKAVTRGHQVVMGRRTFEGLPGPLPQRRNYVVTRQEGYQAEGVEVVHSLEEAISRAEVHATSPGDPLYVLGGAVLYEAAMPIADRLDLTLIDAEIAGDTVFPAFSGADWVEIESSEHPVDEDHRYGFRVSILERRDQIDGVL